MQIDISHDSKVFSPGKQMPIDVLVGKDIPSSRKTCVLSMASPQEANGIPVLLTGEEYIINNKHYNLSAGYGIKATLTPNFTVVPKLRKSVSKEVNVIRSKTGIGICEYWPVVIRLPETIVPEKPKLESVNYDFVQEALQTLSEVNEITESFDISSDHEEEYTEE